mmetsp:Transcript_106182/g.298541  ORF Transcript_106182/g.298541 Transcript_106182/m.298541 type:complete len:294 (-) Transcript_106182:253-1134(-)
MLSHPNAVEEHLRVPHDVLGAALQKAYDTPFVQKVFHDRLLRAQGDVAHQGDVFHEAYGLALWRLGRADEPPVRVVQLPRLRQFTGSRQRRDHAPEMRERRHERQPVEALRNTRPHRLARFVLTPVACGELELQACGEARVVLDHLVDLRCAAAIEGLLQRLPQVLDRLAPQPCERRRHERSRQINAFLTEVVTVVLADTTAQTSEQSVRHVTREISLPHFAKRMPANVRQQLLLQQLASVLHTHVASRAHCRASLGDEIQRHFLRADRGRILNRIPARSQHRNVAEIVNDAL